MKQVMIGNQTLSMPLIQGGMGVGVSLGNLAGHVAKEGGMGIISTAQIGFREKDFENNTQEANLRAIDQEIKKAKSIAQGKGMVGVNIMVALAQYEDHVKQAVKSGADAIISGAGLPLKLPEFVKESATKIAPIVSSGKAAKLILKSWDRHYAKTADFIVIEGWKAGGHLGFKKEELMNHACQSLEEIFKDVKEAIAPYVEKYAHKIPVFVAGGIYTREDVQSFMELGADGVQVGTRFIATKECDASQAYKEAFLSAKEEDIMLVQSPVGMPGRALHNAFMDIVIKEKQPITRCYRCISSCHVNDVPYCITKALIDAVEGRTEEGLLFTGVNGYRIDRIMSVKELINELLGE